MKGIPYYIYIWIWCLVWCGWRCDSSSAGLHLRQAFPPQQQPTLPEKLNAIRRESRPGAYIWHWITQQQLSQSSVRRYLLSPTNSQQEISPSVLNNYVLTFSIGSKPTEVVYVVVLLCGSLWALLIAYCCHWYRMVNKPQPEPDEEFEDDITDIENQSLLERFEELFAVLRTKLLPPAFLFSGYRDMLAAQLRSYHRYYRVGRIADITEMKLVNVTHLFVVQFILLAVLAGVLDVWFVTEDDAQCGHYLDVSACNDNERACRWQPAAVRCEYRGMAVSSAGQLQYWLLAMWWAIFMTSLLDTGLSFFEDFLRWLLLVIIVQQGQKRIAVHSSREEAPVHEDKHNMPTVAISTAGDSDKSCLEPSTKLSPFTPLNVAAIPPISIKQLIRALQAQRTQFIASEKLEQLHNLDVLWNVEYHTKKVEVVEDGEEDERLEECECCCVPTSSFAFHQIHPQAELTLRCKYPATTSKYLQQALTLVHTEQLRQSNVLNSLLTASSPTPPTGSVLPVEDRAEQAATRLVGNTFLQDQAYYHSHLGVIFRQYTDYVTHLEDKPLSQPCQFWMAKLEHVLGGTYVLLACLLTVFVLNKALPHNLFWQLVFLVLAVIAMLLNCVALERLDVMYAHVLLPSLMITDIRMLLLSVLDLLVRYYHFLQAQSTSDKVGEDAPPQPAGGDAALPVPSPSVRKEAVSSPLRIDTSLPSPALASPSPWSVKQSPQSSKINAVPFNARPFFFISHALAEQAPQLLISQLVGFYRSMYPPTHLFQALPNPNPSWSRRISTALLTLLQMHWLYVLPIPYRVLLARLLLLTVAYVLIAVLSTSQVYFFLLVGVVVICAVLYNLQLWHVQHEIDHLVLPEYLDVSLEEESGIPLQSMNGDISALNSDEQRALRRKRKLRNKEHLSKKAFNQKVEKRKKKQQVDIPAEHKRDEEVGADASEEDRAYSISSESHSEEDSDAEDEAIWLQKLNALAALRRQVARKFVRELLRPYLGNVEETQLSTSLVEDAVRDGLQRVGDSYEAARRKRIMASVVDLSQEVASEAIEDTFQHLQGVDFVASLFQQAMLTILAKEQVVSIAAMSEGMCNAVVHDVYRQLQSRKVVAAVLSPPILDSIVQHLVQALRDEIRSSTIRSYSCDYAHSILSQSQTDFVDSELHKQRTEASRRLFNDVMQRLVARRQGQQLVIAVLNQAIAQRSSSLFTAPRSSAVATRRSTHHHHNHHRKSSTHSASSNRKKSVYVPFPVTSITNFSVEDIPHDALPVAVEEEPEEAMPPQPQQFNVDIQVAEKRVEAVPQTSPVTNEPMPPSQMATVEVDMEEEEQEEDITQQPGLAAATETPVPAFSNVDAIPKLSEIAPIVVQPIDVIPVIVQQQQPERAATSPQTTSPPTTADIEAPPAAASALTKVEEKAEAAPRPITPTAIQQEAEVTSKESTSTKRKTKKKKKSVYVAFPRTSLFGEDLMLSAVDFLVAAETAEARSSQTLPTTEAIQTTVMPALVEASKVEANTVKTAAMASSTVDANESNAMEVSAEEVRLATESTSGRQSKAGRKKSTIHRKSILFPRTSLHNDEFLSSIKLDNLLLNASTKGEEQN